MYCCINRCKACCFLQVEKGALHVLEATPHRTSRLALPAAWVSFWLLMLYTLQAWHYGQYAQHTVMAKCPAIVSASSSCDLLLVFNSSLTGVMYIALLVGSILNG